MKIFGFGSHDDPNPFATSTQAKDFLVSQIVEQAQYEGVPFSEIEQRQLYFSEEHPEPDIWSVNEAFDTEYDQDEYERKVRALALNARKRLRADDSQRRLWADAVRRLSKEDHYILVMVA